MKAQGKMKKTKQRLSDVLGAEIADGSQTFTCQGRGTAATAPTGESGRLKQSGQNLLQCLRVPTRYAVDLDVSRSRELPQRGPGDLYAYSVGDHPIHPQFDLSRAPRVS